MGGINTDPVTGKVTVPLEMTLKVLDMILDRMKTAGVDMGKVIGISGNGRVVYSTFSSHKKQYMVIYTIIMLIES